MNLERLVTYRLIRRICHRNRFPIFISVIAVALMLAGTICYKWEVEAVPMPQNRSVAEIREEGILRYVTLVPTNNPFPEKKRWRATEIDNANAVAMSLDLEAEIVEVDSVNTAIRYMFEGLADIMLVPIPDSMKDSLWHVLPCGPEWCINYGNTDLQALVDSVCAIDSTTNKPLFAHSLKQIRKAKRKSIKVKYRSAIGEKCLSEYDNLFKQEAKKYDWDWRMLAAISFCESHFNPEAESGRGAQGLMQMMPITAKRFGIDDEDYSDPEKSVAAACRYLKYLERNLTNKVLTTVYPELEKGADATDEQRKVLQGNLLAMILASYNAGMGHVYDAIMLADALGYNPAVWSNNVETCLSFKTDPKYYKMPVVQSGKFNSGHTLAYVNNVLNTYYEFCEWAEK